MLTQYMLDDLQKINSSEDHYFSQSREISYSTLKGAIEHGQEFYRFNGNKDGLDTFIFCGLVKTLKDGEVAVVHRGLKLHSNNMIVKPYFLRDLLLSSRREYHNESYFVSKEKAESCLNGYIRRKSNEALKMLDETNK